MRGITLIILLLFAKGICFAEDIRDIKPPVNFPPNLFLYIVIIIFLIIALFILAVRIYWVRKRKGMHIDSLKVKPAHIIAFERLELLKNRNLLAEGQIKEFFIQLSNIIKGYIERRFEINAPEMTTEEFLWSLRDSQKLASHHQDLLRKFLDCCDMVKFAKYGPSENEIENSFNSAVKFVDETKLLEQSKED